jgi:hypothetical protein
MPLLGSRKQVLNNKMFDDPKRFDADDIGFNSGQQPGSPIESESSPNRVIEKSKPVHL